MDTQEKMRRIGKNVRLVREERVLSQSELARRAKIHVSTLLKIESGVTKRIREATVRNLAEAFGVPCGEFSKMIGYYSDGAGTVCIEREEWVQEEAPRPV